MLPPCPPAWPHPTYTNHLQFDMPKTCCKAYTIRLDVQQFKPSKAHRQLLRKWHRHLLGGKRGGVRVRGVRELRPRGGWLAVWCVGGEAAEARTRAAVGRSQEGETSGCWGVERAVGGWA